MIGVIERIGDILDQNVGEKRDPKFIRNKIFLYCLIDTVQEKQKKQFKQ